MIVGVVTVLDYRYTKYPKQEVSDVGSRTRSWLPSSYTASIVSAALFNVSFVYLN